MVAHFTMCTNGVNQAFRFVEGIWLHRKSRQIREETEKAYFTSYVRNMLPSYISTMDIIFFKLTSQKPIK